MKKESLLALVIVFCVKLSYTALTEVSVHRRPECPLPKTFWNGFSCECPENLPLFIKDTNTCIFKCPLDKPVYDATYDLCKTCSDNTIWDEASDECKCPPLSKKGFFSTKCDCIKDTVWNSDKTECVCSNGKIWDEEKENCVCMENQPFYNSTSRSCEKCAEKKVWDGYKCVCAGNQITSGFFTASCSCPSHKPMFDKVSMECKECSEGRIWSTEEEACVCPEQTPFFDDNQNLCRQCSGNRFWDGMVCDCEENMTYNESLDKCIPECRGGQMYDLASESCLCPESSYFDRNSKICVEEKCPKNGPGWDEDSNMCACSGGRIFNPSTQECECPKEETYDMNAKACIPIQNLALFSHVTPKCEDGYILNSENVCIQEVQPDCPKDTILKDGACVKSEVKDVECRDGFVYNKKYKKCVVVEEAVCPAGTERIGEECVEIITIKPSCPTGYKDVDGVCIRSECPSGFEIKNGNCVEIIECDVNQELINGLCVDQNCPPGFIKYENVCKLPIDSNCPRNYVFTDGVCRIRVLSDCSDGFILVNGICKRQIDDRCPDGFVLLGQKCVRTLQTQCPQGFELHDSICKRLIDDSCPQGYILNNDRCQRRLSRNCPHGYISHKDTCIQICPPKFENIRGKCVPTREPIVNPRECMKDEIQINKVCYKTKKSCLPGYYLKDDVCHRSPTANYENYRPASINNLNNVNVYTSGNGCFYRNCNRF